MWAYTLNCLQGGWVIVMSSPSSPSSSMMKGSRGDDTRLCLRGGRPAALLLQASLITHVFTINFTLLSEWWDLIPVQLLSDFWKHRWHSLLTLTSSKHTVSTTGTLTDNNPARAHEPDLLLERDPSSRLLLASILGGARRAAPLPRTVRHRDVWTCVYFFICPFFFFFLFYLPLRLTAPDAGLSRLGPVRHLRA